MSLPITIDYRLSLAEGIGAARGPKAADLAAANDMTRTAARGVFRRVDAGELGFFDLPGDAATPHAIDRFVETLSPGFTDIVLLGIGGSSLGARAIYQALNGPPELAASGRRLHLPDNADPWLLSRLLERLDPKHTLVIATSKSGGTVETAAQIVVMRQWLEAQLGPPWAQHLVMVTDPEQGPLRALTHELGLTSFAIPANVGGRFSVLTPVGLLPARLTGTNLVELMAGAEAMRLACRGEDVLENPGLLLAALHVIHHTKYARPIHVLMPYSDALRPFAAWWVQLWAESLGKRTNRRGDTVEVGPTAVPAIGATDQHAQMQLFMEGPRDKLITFISVATPERDIEIPRHAGAFAYLGGHSMHTLLSYELRGTRQALARDGRPSLTLEIDALDARSLGALFFLFEAATAFAGEMYDINAFDQPGVEEGKRLACGLLGRPGYEAAANEVKRFEEGLNPQHRLS